MIHLPKGMTLYRYKSLSNTLDKAAELVMLGRGDGAVVVSDVQTSGRGRNGRIWKSLEGNVHMTIVSDDYGVEGMSLGIGLAICKVIEFYITNNIKIKWPNDILINGKKISGMIMEKVEDKILIGVGINVQHVPNDLINESTSIVNEDMEKVCCDEVCSKALFSINKYLEIIRNEGIVGVKDTWMQYAHGIGSMGEVRGHSKNFQGILKGIDDSGKMMMMLDSGDVQRIGSGEIFIMENGI